MTLLYRAIWQDDRDDLLAGAQETFAEWVDTKGIGLALPEEGAVDGACEHGPVELITRRAESGSVRAAQFELLEDRTKYGERWTTRLTVIDGSQSGERWLWVDLERVAGVGSARPPLAAPRIVRELLDTGRDPRVDQVRLSVKPQQIEPSGLAGLIRNSNRTLPLVVFSEDPAGFDATWARAAETAKRLAGAVQVVVLPNRCVGEFKDRIGEQLGVWGGAARVYLPNVGPSGLRPDRHRYIRLDQMTDGPLTVIRILSEMLTAVITARRPPELYESVRRSLLLGHSDDADELLALAEAEIDRLVAENNELKDEVEGLKEELLDIQVDLEEASIENTRLSNQLRAMIVGQTDSAEAQRVTDLSCSPRRVSEAVTLARERLSMLVIPDGVEHDLDDLDQHVSSLSWAESAWRGLRALHCYAEAGFDGNFRQWCETSGHPWVWPASDKKLSLHESETVESSRRFTEQRRFPVDPAVDPSGFIVMWAHLKIAQGGGPLAPRIYFHDDTRGRTGKIHIGFIGPHKYTENTRTN